MDGSTTLDDDMTQANDPQPRPGAESDEGQSPGGQADGPDATESPIDEVAVDEAALEESAPEDATEPIEKEPHRIVEAVLLSTDAPVTAPKIASILGVGTAGDVRKHIEALNEQYDAQGLSFRVESIAGGYQILTLPAYNTWLTKLLRVRQESKLSPAAMETLAIVAYKQPCTRADVESIRGVAAGDGLNRLREMNLVKIVGRAEDLGRPMLYGTTKRFLETFGLPSLEDLPQVEAFKTLAPVESTGESEAAESETVIEEAVEAASPELEAVEAETAETAETADGEITSEPTPPDAESPNLTLVDDDAGDTSSE